LPRRSIDGEGEVEGDEFGVAERARGGSFLRHEK